MRSVPPRTSYSLGFADNFQKQYNKAYEAGRLAQHGQFHTIRQAASKHLRILVECLLVKQKQTSREIYYELDTLKMKEVGKWLDQSRKIWKIALTNLIIFINHSIKNDEQQFAI